MFDVKCGLDLVNHFMNCKKWGSPKGKGQSVGKELNHDENKFLCTLGMKLFDFCT